MKREFKDLMILEQYDCLNSEITGDYDKAHAVKCVNGTFVGTENHGVASWLLREGARGRSPLQGAGVCGRKRQSL